MTSAWLSMGIPGFPWSLQPLVLWNSSTPHPQGENRRNGCYFPRRPLLLLMWGCWTALMVQLFLLITIPDSYNHYLTLNPVATKHMPHAQHVYQASMNVQNLQITKEMDLCPSCLLPTWIYVTQKERDSDRHKGEKNLSRSKFPDMKESRKDRQSWPCALAWGGKKAWKSRH